jgi:hypothetical protein
MTINKKESQKVTGRPKGNVIELNKPNYTLMAKAFINLYKELGTTS